MDSAEAAAHEAAWARVEEQLGAADSAGEAEEGRSGSGSAAGAADATEKELGEKAAEAEEARPGPAPPQQRRSAMFVARLRAAAVRSGAQPSVVLQTLGLAEVAATRVGDGQTRGISGGQRRRLTAAEVLCGPQHVVLMDSLSTGIDRWLGGWAGLLACCTVPFHAMER